MFFFAGALIREEYITLPDLKAAIETAGFKRTEASANFVCNLLTVLRHNEVIRTIFIIDANS
jgi:hypothetical protein